MTDILLIVLAVLVVLLLAAGGALLLVQRRRRPAPGATDDLERRPPGEELAEPREPAGPVYRRGARRVGRGPAPAEVLTPRGRFQSPASAAPAPPSGAGSPVLFTKGADDEAWDELEEALLAADVGVRPPPSWSRGCVSVPRPRRQTAGHGSGRCCVTSCSRSSAATPTVPLASLTRRRQGVRQGVRQVARR